MYIRLSQQKNKWLIDLADLPSRSEGAPNVWWPLTNVRTKEEALQFIKEMQTAEIREEDRPQLRLQEE